MKTSGLVSNHNFVDHERMLRDRSYRSFGQKPNGGPMDVEAWPSMQQEVLSFNLCLQFSTGLHENYVFFTGISAYNREIRAEVEKWVGRNETLMSTYFYMFCS